ncbi:MlaE family ABC transporter permease [Denitratisoma oestradiolicum]|uniref:ABC transporter permease n=1 Tax=Denitratisoma oestradiolicum TaxID=311182 RepID=A0A6S6Y2Q1_9PROT|nr:ABC transporter permease [Denitratisoma oestradiolicum]TWO79795.1 ABC transporter permease [Denitratisoma oestradiolicum]CAB1369486.1 ABC transporter permease [Denitratisoma oestradiolicum]
MDILPARLAVLELEGRRQVALSGAWTVAGIAAAGPALRQALGALARQPVDDWHCLEVDALDSAGAVLIRRSWGDSRPARLEARDEHIHLFDHLDEVAHKPVSVMPVTLATYLAALRRFLDHFRERLADMLAMLGQFALDLLHLLRHPGDMPWREISANLYKTGFLALPITTLVGFLIGVVLSYLFALQLRQLGAEALIVNVLGLGIVREVGPVLTAVLVAGRSGSAVTAQMGVMRVTEEIDALAAMGVPVGLRVVLPKVLALSITMPLLVLWTSAVALLGGILSAWWQLDIGYDLFLDLLPKVVPIANLWIGQAKGVAFGLAVALTACYFGLRVKPNTESLSANTTASVVISITAVILADAVFAVLTRGVGVPRL